jgi:DNA-binding winged helix-turn-helix (wHTH) protein
MPTMANSALNERSHELGAAVLPTCRYLCFGDFQVDVQREELFKQGSRIHIPSKVYLVLLALIERPGEIVTREQLRARLWPGGTFVNFDANVNTTVNKLRLALGDSPDQPVYVETIPRQGYSFVGSVEAKSQFPRKAAAAIGVGAPTPLREEPETDRAKVTTRAGRMAAFLASGWAAAILLCGVLIGVGIVLITHRPS